MRLIDADELKTKVEAMVVHRVNESDYDFGRNQAFDYVADILIDDAPTIDAVEVVRCKDCRWWNGSKETMHNNHLCRNWSKFGSINTSADDFCSYGERKGGDSE